ncbi:flagellar biosynthetic protein FliR [bacterium]|jgi:flagellar biosynthetic protein FliR|nr:flagellar biosynthetic protein FliR [bacterium]
MVFTLTQITAFFLVFGRLAGMVTIAPFFNKKQVFAMSKVTLIFWASTLLVFLVPLPITPPDTLITFVLALVVEVLIGITIGFVSEAILVAIEFGGSLMDTQAGLSVASLLNPLTGRTSTLISLLLEWTSIMMFLQINGHHMVIAMVHKSFSLIPIGVIPNFSLAGEYIANLGTDLFGLALQLSVPILLIVFLVDFSFGMLSRVAPQVNVFQLGFQLKPTISLIIFLAIAPGMIQSIFRMLENLTEHTIRVLYLMQL